VRLSCSRISSAASRSRRRSSSSRGTCRHMTGAGTRHTRVHQAAARPQQDSNLACSTSHGRHSCRHRVQLADVKPSSCVLQPPSTQVIAALASNTCAALQQG
jgi:hypothetical protein